MRAARWTAPLAALLVSACGGEPETIVEHGTAADHGRALFSDPGVSGTDSNPYSCATCHSATGIEGSDIVLTGGSLNGVLNRPSYWGGQEVDLLRAVNACLYYFMLKEEPWTAQDEEAKAMYAFLSSISPGETADATPFTVVTDIADLPKGDASRGEDAYRRACANCHGTRHAGTGKLVERAPTLPDQTLKDHPLGDYTPDDQRLVFVEKARHGAFLSYTGTMPPFSLESLSDTEMADILTYLDLY